MMTQATLALDGGRPIRAAMLPYGRHRVDDADIEAVVAVLRSDWLTTGPTVDEFEAAFAGAVGARYAVALPIFPAMTDADVEDVVHAVEKVLGHFRR